MRIGTGSDRKTAIRLQHIGNVQNFLKIQTVLAVFYLSHYLEMCKDLTEKERASPGGVGNPHN